MHTGTVVIVDGGEVFGETPDIAARVQTAAEPDTVVATQRPAAGTFMIEQRGPRALTQVARDPPPVNPDCPLAIRMRAKSSARRQLFRRQPVFRCRPDLGWATEKEIRKRRHRSQRARRALEGTRGTASELPRSRVRT
jgi:hypothetical protein